MCSGWRRRIGLIDILSISVKNPSISTINKRRRSRNTIMGLASLLILRLLFAMKYALVTTALVRIDCTLGQRLNCGNEKDLDFGHLV